MNAYTVKVGDVVEVDGNPVTITGFSYGGHVRWDHTPPLPDPAAWDTHVLWSYWVKMVDDKRTSASRCKGCKWWSQLDAFEWGECAMMDGDDDRSQARLFDGTNFATLPTFGCVHWEAKQ